MISTVMATPVFGVRTGAATRSEEARETQVSALPSAKDARRAQQDRQKAMASDRLFAVLERLDALRLMIKVDPKAALQMATAMAKELTAAVKAYREAGGRNVSMGEFAMIRREASQARDTQEALAESGQLGAEAMAAQIERADRLAQAETDALSDMSFFDLVRGMIGALEKAHEGIKARAPESRSNPDEDDWKAAEEAHVELKRELVRASGGVSIRV